MKRGTGGHEVTGSAHGSQEPVERAAVADARKKRAHAGFLGADAPYGARNVGVVWCDHETLLAVCLGLSA
jgi:hypothetical protein